MQFVSPYQHGLAQLSNLRTMIGRDDLTDRGICFLLSQLAVYGLDSFATQYERLFPQLGNVNAKHFCQKKQQEWLAIQRIPDFKAVARDKALAVRLLNLNEPYFERGQRHPEKVLIVFTTMYNNFFFSNVVLLAFLRALGVSVLILKDSSVYNYLKGITGFGTSFDSAIESIEALVEREAIVQVYLSGFSSGGYASLLMSSRMRCDGYLGFSIHSDICDNSSLPASKFFTREVAAAIDTDLKRDLARLFRDQSVNCKRKIIYGEHSNTDVPHAENLRGIKGVDVTKLENSGHITLAPLLVQNRLLLEFETLLF